MFMQKFTKVPQAPRNYANASNYRPPNGGFRQPAPGYPKLTTAGKKARVAALPPENTASFSILYAPRTGSLTFSANRRFDAAVSSSKYYRFNGISAAEKSNRNGPQTQRPRALNGPVLSLPQLQ
jgi:hypothetical protein